MTLRTYKRQWELTHQYQAEADAERGQQRFKEIGMEAQRRAEEETC